ncbi:MAG: S8 family serine peptidase [Ktedonobacteraceae bacterium]
MTQQSTNTRQPMSKVVYWQENQLAVTHHSRLNITEGKKSIIASLDLETLDSTLYKIAGYHVESFTIKDVPRPYQPDTDRDRDHDKQRKGQEDSNENTGVAEPPQSSLQSPIGKYLFPHPFDDGTIVVSFFHISHNQPLHGPDKTSEAVELINEKLELFDHSEKSRLLTAMPNWLNGGTNICPDHITHGCPVSPPIPVSDTCASGNWHITLPSDLPNFIQDATGAGVTVLVLDTLPRLQQIYQAVASSGDSNGLLLDIVENVTLNYQVLSDVLDVPSPDQPTTGKDITGKLVGFPMSDHGLFVVGIIRDLAPDAHVECIRVLNDYGVGDTTMLIDALTSIQNRLSAINPETGEPGDLYNTPAVVNMSLVATPANEDLANWGYSDFSIAPARKGLLYPIQALAAQGVVFAASAGNDTDPRDTMMNPSGKRWGPRYPAAFAYPMPNDYAEPGIPTIIPAGAVNQAGAASAYSNYPGALGIGTYGGDMPKASAAAPDAITGTQVQPPIDAPRGIHTDPFYPALAETDPLPMHSPAPIAYPEYQPAPADTWAYWSGTSFATPIVSALAARVMETLPSVGDSVRQTLLASAPDQVDWTNLDTGESDAWGPMIMVSQECESVVIVEIVEIEE